MYCTPCCCQHYYRISDGGVFRNSPLSKALSSDENPLSIPDPKDIESRRKIPYIILADYASPLKVLIMRCHSSLNLTLHHIYIYIEREREREREVDIKVYSVTSKPTQSSSRGVLSFKDSSALLKN